MGFIKNTFPDVVSSTEKSLRGTGRQPARKTPKERGHAVVKLAESRNKMREDEARELVRLARKVGFDVETLAKIDNTAKTHAQSSETWIFIMISPAQNAEVIRWINANSKRPHKAVELWATLLERLRIDTGEIMASRQELAERVNTELQHITNIMTELASIKAIRKEKRGREVRYFLNPNIATHLPSAARKAAREDAGPLLTIMEGGQVNA